jgi:hypothetical protein
MKVLFILWVSIIAGNITVLKAQQSLYPVDSIYLSGVVFDADSVSTLPYAHITINDKPITVTDAEGQFIIYMSRKDTFRISYVGFKNFEYTFPEKTYRDEFYIRVPLSRDSIVLKTVDIYPWPKKGAFRQAFLDAKTADKKDVPLVIPGAVQYDGPKKETKATIANPASFLQEKLSKKARNKRKIAKYKKQLQEGYYEYEK